MSGGLIFAEQMDHTDSNALGGLLQIFVQGFEIAADRRQSIFDGQAWRRCLRRPTAIGRCAHQATLARYAPHGVGPCAFAAASENSRVLAVHHLVIFAAQLKCPLLALTLCVAGWPVRAYGAETTAGPSDPMTDTTAVARTAFIQNRLDQGTASARWWWYGWLGGYSLTAVAQASVGIATHDEALRATMLVGASGSALGALSVIAFPFPPTSAASEVRAMNGATVQQRHAFALQSLEACADAERMGRSWVPHALGVAIAAAQGLILWIGFDQPIDGAESAAISLVVSEAQIFSQPMRAVDDLASYERELSPPHRAAVQWRLAPASRGLALRGEW